VGSEDDFAREKVACARYVHREIKENLGTTNMSRLNVLGCQRRADVFGEE